MGPALELFILLLLGLAVVVGGVLFFTRPVWKRAAKTLVETDRHERQALEEQARERAEEAECRRRAEEELHRALKGEDVPRHAAAREQGGEHAQHTALNDEQVPRPSVPTPQTMKPETNVPCEEVKTDQIQAGERP